MKPSAEVSFSARHLVGSCFWLDKSENEEAATSKQFKFLVFRALNTERSLASVAKLNKTVLNIK